MLSFPFSVTARDDETEVSVAPAPPSASPGVSLDLRSRGIPWDGDLVDAGTVLSPLAARELATALLVAAHKAEPKEAHLDALRVAAEEVRP